MEREKFNIHSAADEVVKNKVDKDLTKAFQDVYKCFDEGVHSTLRRRVEAVTEFNTQLEFADPEHDLPRLGIDGDGNLKYLIDD